MAPRVFALNVHANWACRHSGACCSAGWAIPVEPSRRAVLGTDLLIPDADGVCRFHDRDAKRCRVHAEHGEDMLPGSCVHFPRRALIDNRGVHVSLSHFCPTAARMLVTTPGPLHIVENPPAFPATRPYEGLDGRETFELTEVRTNVNIDNSKFAKPAPVPAKKSWRPPLQPSPTRSSTRRAYGCTSFPSPRAAFWPHSLRHPPPDALPAMRRYTSRGSPRPQFFGVKACVRVAS